MPAQGARSGKGRPAGRAGLMQMAIVALATTGELRFSTSPLVGEVDVRSTAGEGKPEADCRVRDLGIECGIFLSVALDPLEGRKITQLRHPLFRRYAPPSPTRGEGSSRLSTSPLVGEVDSRSAAGEGKPEADCRACDQNIERGIFSSVALDPPTARESPQLRHPLFRRYAPPSPTRGEGSRRSALPITYLQSTKAA